MNPTANNTHGKNGLQANVEIVNTYLHYVLAKSSNETESNDSLVYNALNEYLREQLFKMDLLNEPSATSLVITPPLIFLIITFGIFLLLLSAYLILLNISRPKRSEETDTRD